MVCRMANTRQAHGDVLPDPTFLREHLQLTVDDRILVIFLFALAHSELFVVFC